MRTLGLHSASAGGASFAAGTLATFGLVGLLFAGLGCDRPGLHSGHATMDGSWAASYAPGTVSLDAGPAAGPPGRQAARVHARVPNPAPYIPPQCFAKTLSGEGPPASNPCYPCHVHSEAPNFNDDADLQLVLLMPPATSSNPWKNLLEPPVARVARSSDADVLAYVRESNYFDPQGRIVLAERLAQLPGDWDQDADRRWSGFVPDVRFVFDERGFDHAADGSRNGWRAFAYAPFPGAFFPTNGSADDVLIRLDPILRQRADGQVDAQVYELNLAVVEALITRSDVPIEPVDETAFGVDLDLDGKLGRARAVAFDSRASRFRGDGGSAGEPATRMHYVGRALQEERAGNFPIAPGLFPLGTEFFHTVRYLDVGSDGVVTMAARMKEVRYAKKVRYLTYDALAHQAAADAREQAESPDGAHRVRWQKDRGIDNGQGWLFQAFIEDAGGALRPQTREETSACAGCHGGIGITTDSIFSFPRKLGPGAMAGGWFHWSQHDLRGLPEPKRSDGRYEYTLYLQQAHAGDDLRENDEVLRRFFDSHGVLRPSEIDQLHGDISRLLVPSAARALDLDRAYRAIVAEQSFVLGRDVVLAPTPNVYRTVTRGDRTGVGRPVSPSRLARR
jgi:hypothetical protein